MNAKPKVFVLMPFSEPFKAIFEDAIKKSLEEVGYSVHRADSKLSARNILRDIVEGILTAKLVIADLTGRNANVFYELGLAHAINIPVLHITQSIEDVPFDLRTYKVIEYSRDFSEMPKFIHTLRKYGFAHLNNEVEFGNPLSDFSISDVNTQYNESVREIVKSLEEMSDNVDDPNGTEEKGLWDYIYNSVGVLEELTTAFTDLHMETTDLTEYIKTQTTKYNNLAASGTSGSTKQMYNILNLLATKMKHYDSVTNDKLELIRNVSDVLGSDLVHALTWVDNHWDDDGASSIREMRTNMSQLEMVVRDINPNISHFEENIRQLSEMKISQSITKSSRGLASTLSRLVEEFNGLVVSLQNGITKTDDVLHQHMADD